MCNVATNSLVGGRTLFKIIAPGSSIVGGEQIIAVPFPSVQEGLVESEDRERVSQRTTSIMKDIGSQLPEDQGEGEEIVIKNTFPQVVRKQPSRPRAHLVPSLWKPECANESIVEVPVPHFSRRDGGSDEQGSLS